jgi:hypothetical protein
MKAFMKGDQNADEETDSGSSGESHLFNPHHLGRIGGVGGVFSS